MTRYARGYSDKKSKQEHKSTSWPLLKVKANPKNAYEPKAISSEEKGRSGYVAESSSASQGWFKFHVNGRNKKSACAVKCPSSGNTSGNADGKVKREGRVISKEEMCHRQANDGFIAVYSTDCKERCNKICVPKKEQMSNFSSANRINGKNIKSRANLSVEDLRNLRRKEKALKREKKKVCFCCRRSGHQLADCPDFTPMGSSDVSPPAGGLCYHCGSTEHNVNQCSRKGANHLKFARCFVCGEDGHLARDCQENPRGKYPKGGACRLCGETNHLFRECPLSANTPADSQDDIVWCGTEGPVESLPEDIRKLNHEKVSSKKIIQF
ncbi:uncharacterized protein LOC124170699 [Ischnura elegans]|uniref:uncharacterized protein LOC124170699 n=1 Tax=Ischnura elegans TaxID=197161 RepID=UPI001ED86EFE|nr:uncharacterized protein LOC124170699 [Ischnura elegans]